MGETSDGQAATGAALSDDGDPDSPARFSFFSRIFRRDPTEGESFGAVPRGGAVGARELIINLRNLRRMRVDDVSVPRADIVAIPDTATLDEVVKVFQEDTLTRLPVYAESLDQPIGLLHFKDFALRYGFGATPPDFDLAGLVRPLLYAPPSMPIWVLLQKMQTARIHMALVIDEYGGVDGLVTIEDLLEQIVGDIADEHDEDESQLWAEEAPGIFLTQARIDLEAFEAAAGVKLAPPELAEEVDTLGGLVIRLAGRVPVRGEVVLHPDGHEFEVVDADARRIKRVRVRLADVADVPAEAAEWRPLALIALERRVNALAGLRRLALAAACGAGMALAQPPVSWPLALFVVLPVLLWLLDGVRGPRAAFAVGWAAGAGHFAAALFWIVDPFLVEPEVFGWMAPFALAGMAGGLALFWAVPFALARAWWPAGLARILLLAALWTLSDYARSRVLTGFPWGLTAYAWVETPVIQTVALFGPHTLGLLTLAAALLPALRSWPATAAALVLVAAGWGYGAWRLAQPGPERATPLVVRLVQPNARQELKWQPGMEQLFYDRHIALTAAPADPPPAVTIWSETAVPFVLGQAPALQAQSAAAAGDGRLILGIRRLEPSPDGDRWFNSLAVLNGDGTPAATYDKYRLVPFGEYIPFPRTVARLGLPALATLTSGGFTPGSGPHLVAVPGLPPFLPLICYEAIFPHGLRAPEGRAEWLVQVTNDAWFGEASGPWQHLAQARVRAIEQGLPLARAANTGVSAMIDPFGRVIGEIGLDEQGFLDAVLPGPLPETPYARYRDLWALTAIAGFLGLTVSIFYGGIFLKLRR